MTTALDDSGVMFADGTKVASAKELLHLNDIVNGDFRIAQAGTSFAAPGSGAYDLDGWQHINTSAAVVTVAQVAGSTAGRLARQATITTVDTAVAIGDVLLDQSRMEGSNIEKYVGNTFTVAFRARVPVAGIHCVSLRNGSADRSYVAEINFPTANVYQNCSVTVVGGLPTAGVWNYTNGLGLALSFAHMCGTTYQTTPNAWQTGEFYATANQVNDCATLSNVWAMEKVTMNLGTVAAVSEIDVGDELRRCRRYYRPLVSQAARGAGYAKTATVSASSFYFDEMRTVPTVAISAAGDFVIQYLDTAVAPTAVATTETTGSTVGADWTAAGLTAGQGTIVRAGNANAKLILSARL